MRKSNYEGDCKTQNPLDTRQVLDLIMHHLHIDKNDPKVDMSFNWVDIIGSRLAPHISLVDLKNDALLVRADHPTWAQLFSLDQKKIVKKLNMTYPSLGIKRIIILN